MIQTCLAVAMVLQGLNFFLQERDTSAVAVTIPVPRGDPFPRAFHRSEIKSEVRLGASVLSTFINKLLTEVAPDFSWHNIGVWLLRLSFAAFLILM